MKRMAGLLLAMFWLMAGCGKSGNTMDHALWLRSQLALSGCCFEAVITADYGDALYHFTLQCQSDPEGNITFCVSEPASIAGISGKIEASGGKVTFDEVALSLPLLADDQLAPVAAPWALVRTLRGGYMISSGPDGEYTRLTINDTYAEEALTLDIWLDEKNIPFHTEIEWNDRRILTMEIKNFTMG